MKIYAVLPQANPETMATQATSAESYGADGVFVPNPNKDPHCAALIEAYGEVIQAVQPETFVGVHSEGVRPQGLLYKFDRALHPVSGDLHDARRPDALWVADANDQNELNSLRNFIKSVPSLIGMRFMGGIAHIGNPDYTENPRKAELATRRRASNLDVIVTSGDKAGNPPDMDKVRAMHKVKGYLAVAGTLRPDQLAKYAPYVDELLVPATISDARLASLIEAAHQFERR